MRLGLAFSPKRLSIAAGQSVTFFGEHDAGLQLRRPSAASRRRERQRSGRRREPDRCSERGLEYTVAFPAAGTYGYFCQAHEGMGMYGAVQVK